MPNGQLHKPMKLDRKLVRSDLAIRRDLEAQFAAMVRKWEKQLAHRK